MSNWEDTVMCYQEMREAMSKSFYNKTPDSPYLCVAKTQAEISFKAGYEQCEKDERDDEGWRDGHTRGINEVVEWIEKHNVSTCMDCSCAYDFRTGEWQAQLKKWKVKQSIQEH